MVNPSEQYSLGEPERRYQPGDTVPQSGIYQAVHADGEIGTQVLLQGQSFPICRECGRQVRYHLLRASPYIFEDEDFRLF